MTGEQGVVDLVNSLPHSAGGMSFLQGFCYWMYNQSDAPLLYALPAALGLIAANTHPQTHVYFGAPLWPIYWGQLIGESGQSRKTTVLSCARRIQNLADGSRTGEEPGSVEGLVESLAVQAQQVIFYDELGDFLARTQEGYLASLRERYTLLYDGAPLTRRLRRDNVRVDVPRLSLLGGVTLAYLEAYTTTTDWEGGFLGRWGIFFGTRQRTYAVPPDRSSVREDWLTAKLLTIQQTPPGVCLGMNADALDRWHQWYETLDARAKASPPWYATAAVRAPSHALRTAMLLAVDLGRPVDNGTWHIDRELLDVGIRLTELHLESIQYVVSKLAQTMYERERRTILRALDKCTSDKTPFVDLGAILGRCVPKLPKKLAVSVLDTLVEERSVYVYAQAGSQLFGLVPPEFADADVL